MHSINREREKGTTTFMMTQGPKVRHQQWHTIIYCL